MPLAERAAARVLIGPRGRNDMFPSPSMAVTRTRVARRHRRSDSEALYKPPPAWAHRFICWHFIESGIGSRRRSSFLGVLGGLEAPGEAAMASSLRNRGSFILLGLLIAGMCF